MTPAERELLFGMAECIKVMAQRMGLHSDIVDVLDILVEDVKSQAVPEVPT